MTWRRFVALLTGLSPQSRWMLAARGNGDTADRRRITDPDAAEAYFAAIG